MKAVLFYGPQNIRYEETMIKPLAKGEILVKIEAALTCGTDVKTYRRGHPVLIKQIPSGFGHEFSGVGEYNLCENLDLLNGAYAEYIVVPERIVRKNTLLLPPSLPFEKAAFCEPLANVVHGVERTGIKPGQTVGVIGIGPIGLMFARLCKLKGARVIVAGRNPIKLKLAEEFAHADEIVDLKKYANPERIFKDFSDEKKGLDVAIECVGMPEIWELVFSCVRPGGTVHFFGGCKSGSKVSIDTTKMHYGDIRLMSVFHHTPKYFRQALDLIASGDIEVEKLITEELPLEKVEYAMQRHIEGSAIKFLIRP